MLPWPPNTYLGCSTVDCKLAASPTIGALRVALGQHTLAAGAIKSLLFKSLSYSETIAIASGHVSSLKWVFLDRLLIEFSHVFPHAKKC